MDETATREDDEADALFVDPGLQHVVAQLVLLRKLNMMGKKTAAEKMGIAPRILDRWEQGRACPTVAEADAYANLFGLTIGLVINVEETDGNV
jgi:DNA-binding XRE family transcriptional regulator